MTAVPRTKIDAQNILRELWADTPEARLGCVIIDFLSKHTDAAHIPFSQFFEIARENQIGDNDVVANIVNYLTGTHLNLLNTGFEYIDGDIVEQLEPSQVKAAKYNNINPLTGETDDEIGDKIFMFFLPSELAKQALVAG
jgi:hypothetical protein